MTILLVLAACSRPPEAPRALDELTPFLYREWANEDPAVLEAGIDNLEDFLARQDDLSLDTPVNDRSWELSAIRVPDLAGIDRPRNREPSDTLGIGVVAESHFPVADHAAWQTQRDQAPVEPNAVSYTRTFPEVETPACFTDATCTVLVTENDVLRENFLMAVRFPLFKDFRWVERADGSEAVIARSWISESAVGEKGKSTIWQSYSLDVWIGVGERAWRYQVLWGEADIAGASEALQLSTIKVGTDQVFAAAEEVLGAH